MRPTQLIGIPTLSVRFKKLDSKAVIPVYQKVGDAGLDLTSTSKEYDEEKEKLVFGTGLSVEIPYGYVGLIFPRSSIVKTKLSLANSVGVIDANFRGELKLYFEVGSRATKNYEVGDRIGQLVILPLPIIEVIETTNNLSETDRGEGGFGSTGK